MQIPNSVFLSLNKSYKNEKQFLIIIYINFQVQEFNKHDKDPAKYVKQWRGTKPKTGASYSCDIGYERFLGPEVCIAHYIQASCPSNTFHYCKALLTPQYG